MKMKKSLLIVGSLVAIAACQQPSHPKMLSFTPASVVIDYSQNDLYQATQLAQQFCSSIDRDAQYVRSEEKGWGSPKKHAYYNCVESARRNRD